VPGVVRQELLQVRHRQPPTVVEVLARIGCDQISAPLRARQEDRSVLARPQVSFGGAVRQPEGMYDRTSPQAVAELRGRLDRGS
jgi:hypothetical protein